MAVEEQKKAWEYLQGLDTERFLSRNRFIYKAINAYAEAERMVIDEQTRRQVDECAAQIAKEAIAILEKMLPAYLAGCFSAAPAAAPNRPLTQEPKAPEKVLEPEVDDFLLGYLNGEESEEDPGNLQQHN